MQLVPGSASGFELAYDATNYDQCVTGSTSYVRGSVIRLDALPVP